MAASSTAHARWEGNLTDGSGTATTDSPALDSTTLTWRARIGETSGTTPEELLAAAHAGCFAMALSGALSKAGHEPRVLEVDATVAFGPVDGGFAVQGVHLVVQAEVPGLDEDTFREHARSAKDGCPISKALSSELPVELEARLLQAA